MNVPTDSKASVDFSSGKYKDQNTQRFALSVVIALFFMWGFITCLNDILIPHLKAIFELSYLQSSLIQFTFFGAYFLISLPGGKLIAYVGYKRGMVIGLLVCGLGALLFHPAASFLSYPLFLGAFFVLASGITILQVASNAYVVVLGNPETASSRLNLAQAFNSLGTTLAPLFGGWLILAASDQVLASDRLHEAALVKGPYIGLALTLGLIAVVISCLKLPPIPNAEGDEPHSIAGVLKIRHLVLGALGIFLYVGAEVSIGSYLINFLADSDIAGLSHQDAARYVGVYWGGAMIGRFVGAALLQRAKPSSVLAVYAASSALLLGVAIFTNGLVAMWSVLIIGFFNSIMFPNIFTLGIDGLGHRTSAGASLLIMAIVGGAIVPVLMGFAADTIGIHHSLIIPVICYLYIIYYGISGWKPRRELVEI